MTTLDSKIAILHELDQAVNFEIQDEEDDEWGLIGFAEVWNLSIPLASLIAVDMAAPTEDGKNSILDCFHFLCENLDIDPDGDYGSLDEMLTIAEVDNG